METGDDTKGRLSIAQWTWLLPSLVALVPLLIWWLGWYPGFLSVESLQQWAEIRSGDFTNGVPAAHTLLVWLVTRLGDSPAVWTLLQVVLTVVLLAAYTRAVVKLGVPLWAPAVVVVIYGFLPGPGSGTVSLDVHTAQALVFIWLLVEALLIAPKPVAYFRDPTAASRLGVALGAAWVLDHTGIVVVVIIAGGLSVAFRNRLHLMVRPLLMVLAVVVAVQGVVYAAAGVDREVRPVAEAYAPEIASVVRHSPDAFGEGDHELLRAVADLDVWSDAYRCGEGAALLRDRDFDTAPIRDDPGAYRGLLLRTTLKRPHIVVGHRLCASALLFLPKQSQGERFEAYVYNVPSNDLGVERETKSETAFNVTKAILVRTDRPGSLWLFWRPALLVWPALALFVIAAVRGRRRLLYPSVVFGAALGVTALTLRSPAFLEVFPAYAIALLSLPLWWLALRRSET